MTLHLDALGFICPNFHDNLIKYLEAKKKNLYFI